MLDKIRDLVVDGEIGEIEETIQEALDSGITPKDILDNGLLAGMTVVGDLFKEGEMFVPEVLIAAKTMECGMEKIKPLLNSGDVKTVGHIVFATVKGDLHDIGKKLCAMMLEGAGYKVHDLGVDVSPEAICQAVKEEKPDIVAMSAMLTTTMMSMGETIEALKKEGLYDSVDVMIGGAPVSEAMAVEIGARYSPDAAGAVDLANELIAK